jgi:hypothetical protein
VSIEMLARNRQLTRQRIERSVRRLKSAGALPYGHRSPIVPGPMLWRLSDDRLDGLWQRLLVLAAPDSPLADGIRRRLAGPGTAVAR